MKDSVYSRLMFCIIKKTSRKYEIYGPGGVDPNKVWHSLYATVYGLERAIEVCDALGDAWAGGYEQARFVIRQRINEPHHPKENP